jgi:hypothetical protein
MLEVIGSQFLPPVDGRQTEMTQLSFASEDL